MCVCVCVVCVVCLMCVVSLDGCIGLWMGVLGLWVVCVSRCIYVCAWVCVCMCASGLGCETNRLGGFKHAKSHLTFLEAFPLLAWTITGINVECQCVCQLSHSFSICFSLINLNIRCM